MFFYPVSPYYRVGLELYQFLLPKDAMLGAVSHFVCYAKALILEVTSQKHLIDLPGDAKAIKRKTVESMGVEIRYYIRDTGTYAYYGFEMHIVRRRIY